MSGHSKWNNIRIKKGKMDAQRGKLFTKLSKEILMAGKGGADPEANFSLRVAIERAKAANMPNSNIDRLLEKLQGGGSDDLEEVTYEGYGPGGVAILVEAATDNRNRTAAEVRLIFNKNGGSLGESGCVAWMFDRRGQIVIDADGVDEEEVLMAAMEAGALDMESDDGLFCIYTESGELHQVSTDLEHAGFKPKEVQLTMVPKNTVAVDASTAPSVLGMTESLEDHDDVQRVYANFDIPDEVLEAIEAATS